MGDVDREPCPYRIVEDAGGAFLLGAVGGSIWHLLKGARNAPRGSRIAGALTAARLRAPILGGNFGVWGCLFSAFGAYRGSCGVCWRLSGLLWGGAAHRGGGGAPPPPQTAPSPTFVRWKTHGTQFRAAH